MKLLDTERFCAALQPVTSTSLFKYLENDLTFDENGLLSYEIFGSSETERRNKYSYIDLKNVEVLHPVLFDNLKNNRRLVSILLNEKKFKFKAGDIVPDPQGETGIEFFKTLIGKYKTESERVQMTLDIIEAKPEQAFIKKVIVIPAAFRETGKELTWKTETELNKAYMDVLRVAKSISPTGDKAIYASAIQKRLKSLFVALKAEIGSKKGIIRSNILGKRLDFSGRAVITLDNSLPFDTCAIPLLIAVKIFEPFLIYELGTKNKGSTFTIYTMLEDVYNNGVSSQFFKDVQEAINTVMKKRLVILNRQPTLHRLGLLAFHPVLTTDNVVKLNPYVLSGYNADFDGDSIVADVNLFIDGQALTVAIEDLEHHDFTIPKEQKVTDKGVHVSKFSLSKDVFIDAISIETGETGKKKITEFSKHENIDLYKIEDTKERFKAFWASSDHSLLVYDEATDAILKITPQELLQSPDGKFLIQKKVSDDKS